jgi:hypothetical protein
MPGIRVVNDWGDEMEQKRKAPRMRVLKAGAIEFGGGAIDCTIRNISETGAALEVASPFGIPQEVKLVNLSDRSVRGCHIVWRKEKRLGVRFLVQKPF